eukprot:XP_001694277.1 predicted protein [Chlamydomonas reinhardtii]
MIVWDKAGITPWRCNWGAMHDWPQHYASWSPSWRDQGWEEKAAVVMAGITPWRCNWGAMHDWPQHYASWSPSWRDQGWEEKAAVVWPASRPGAATGGPCTIGHSTMRPGPHRGVTRDGRKKPRWYGRKSRVQTDTGASPTFPARERVDPDPAGQYAQGGRDCGRFAAAAGRSAGTAFRPVASKPPLRGC